VIAAVVAVGVYGGVVLSRLPVGQAIVGGVADRALAASAALGLVVGDIEVEGRETTDRATIMAALAAERGTPILAVSPSRAKEKLESLPWVRSATIERRLPGTLVVRLVERHPLAARIQDPGAARLQLTVRNIEDALDALRGSGPSTVVSSGGRIITQPQYRVAVVSDLNGLFLVLTDRATAVPRRTDTSR